MATSVLEAISNELATAAEASGNSVVAVHARRWMPASGIEWKPGVVVTAHHGVRRDEDIHVALAGGQVVKATLAGRDPSTDIAVLRIDTPEIQRAASPGTVSGDSTTLKLGHVVLALGRTRRGELVASSGIVGGISGEWKSWRGGQLDQHIRLDLALYPGFSGGPLVNTRGAIVGMNTRGLSRGRAVTVPVATVTRVVEELLEKGHVARPYLGLSMQPAALPENARKQLNSEARAGLLVVHVESDGPAEKAGLLLGDLLIDLAGQPVERVEAIQEFLYGAKVGQKVEVRLVRAGEIKSVTITLGERAR